MMNADGGDRLARFIDEQLGERVPLSVEPMLGGGSCDVFAIDRGASRWVLRRAPRHASSETAHDVLREFRILAAIADQHVPIPTPVVACRDPEVFGAPFYVMERIDGVAIRDRLPDAWKAAPERHGDALEQLVDALGAVHAVDWASCGLADMAHGDRYLPRQLGRWLDQLASYGGRDLAVARRVADWLDANLPPAGDAALCHGDYKLDNVLFATSAPPQLLAIVDWEMAAIGDPLIDLAWAMIFHPGPSGTMPLGTSAEPRFAVEHVASPEALVARYAARSGRSVEHFGWYEVFARWKLAIVLEGSYAKFLRGESDKPMHEYFGRAADRLLDSALLLIEKPVAHDP